MLDAKIGQLLHSVYFVMFNFFFAKPIKERKKAMIICRYFDFFHNLNKEKILFLKIKILFLVGLILTVEHKY